MRILLFTVLNCKSCDRHRKSVIALCREMLIRLNVYNIDDPRYFSFNLKAMKNYHIKKTPSIVVLSEDSSVITTIEGVRGTIEKLRNIINLHKNEET